MSPTKMEQLTLQEKNSSTYIGGYIVKKIKNNICATCRKTVSFQICDDNPDHDFLSMKNHADVQVGLQAPNNTLVNVLQQLEVNYRKFIEDVIHTQGVKAILVSTLSTGCTPFCEHQVAPHHQTKQYKTSGQ